MTIRRFLSSSASAGLLTLMMIPASFAAEPAPFSQKPFTDVSSSAWYFEGVEYLRTNNILKGYLDGTYHPNKRISRADFLQVMTTPLFLHGREENCIQMNTTEQATTVFFPDVLKSAPYATDVCVAKINDLVRGFDDGMFRPNRPVSFVEAAKVIARVFSIDVRNDNTGAPDPKWYKVYVDVLAGMHAIPSTINPASQRSLARPITRAEMAYMIHAVAVSGQHQ